MTEHKGDTDIGRNNHPGDTSVATPASLFGAKAVELDALATGKIHTVRLNSQNLLEIAPVDVDRIRAIRNEVLGSPVMVAAGVQYSDTVEIEALLTEIVDLTTGGNS